MLEVIDEKIFQCHNFSFCSFTVNEFKSNHSLSCDRSPVSKLETQMAHSLLFRPHSICAGVCAFCFFDPRQTMHVLLSIGFGASHTLYKRHHISYLYNTLDTLGVQKIENKKTDTHRFTSNKTTASNRSTVVSLETKNLFRRNRFSFTLYSRYNWRLLGKPP